MNIQRKNSAHHFRMQGEREQTYIHTYIYSQLLLMIFFLIPIIMYMLLGTYQEE